MDVKSKTGKDTQVNIVHVFNAPRELVFRAWADPQLLVKWFAPDGCSIHFTEIDIRKGGRFHSCIRHPKYGDCWCKGVYHEVVFPEKIEYSIAMSDEAGNAVDSIDAGKSADWPKETKVTVLFTDFNGKTKITLTQNVAESIAKESGAYPSWLQMLERLDKELYQLNKSN